MIKLIVSLVIFSFSPCKKALSTLRNIEIFTVNFMETIHSRTIGNSKARGTIWFKNGRARIEIFSPDTELIFIEDTLIKTLNLRDSTLIIQRKMGKTEFFYNLVRKNSPDRIEHTGDTCIAWFYPEIESIDSIQFKFMRDTTPMEAVLYQANVIVDVKLKGFRVLRNLPDSILSPPEIPGIHIIKF